MHKAGNQRSKADASAQTPSTRFTARPGVHIAALALLSLGIYATALSNGFVSDDDLHVLKNPLITDWRRIPEVFSQSAWAFAGMARMNFYRPLQFLAYMAVYGLVGFDARVYHLLVLLLHAGSSVLVYVLARKWLDRWHGALLAGLLFALHPIHSEVVVWIDAVPDAAATMLTLAALCAFAACGARPRGRTLAAIASLFFAALLSKEIGALLLPLLIACELVLCRRGIRELWRNKWFYALLAAVASAYLVLRYHALGGLAPGQGLYFQLTPSEYFFSIFWLAGKYLLKLVLPLGLNYFHVFSPVRGISFAWLLALAACLAVPGAIVYLRYGKTSLESARTASNARISFFLLFTLAGLVPVLNITGLGPAPFAERYLYLPSAGFVLLVGECWNLLLPRLSAGGRKAAWVAALLVLAAAAGQILARIPVWKSDWTLLTRTAEQSPGAGWIRSQLAWLKLQYGQLDGAESDYRAAVQESPRSAPLRTSLAVVLIRKRQYVEAMQELQAALTIEPKYADAHLNLGLALEAGGQPEPAASEYKEAIRLDPKNAQALVALGLIEFNAGRKEQAIALYRQASQANPEHVEAHINLGAALIERREFSEAAVELRRAMELAPQHPLLHYIHYDLGVAYRGLNLPEPAAREFQEALRARPDFQPARQQLLELQTKTSPADPLGLNAPRR